MHAFEFLLGLIAACIALAVVAQRLNVPLAVVLVVAGMGLALIPGLPTIALDPELALVLFLPPLLQLSAYRTDWPAFRENLRPILLLAIGAVFFTAAAVALVTKLLIPSMPWWAAVTLGAIVAPPDAVAAKAVLKQFALPKRLVTVLEGESLINDASSLVLYRFAVGATVAGSVSYGAGIAEFFGAALGGAAVGYAVGRLAMWVFARIEDTLLDIAVGLLAGFAAYLAAEAVHVSGVLGAVACGFVLGRHQYAEFTAKTRLESNAVWAFLEFVLTSLVFMLIGLQLRGMVARLGAYDFGQLAGLAAAISVTLIVSRFLWVFPVTWLPRLMFRRVRETDPAPPTGHSVILSWAGMRGVVSLAAALALPASFPGRDLIVLLAFCAILATLVVQGTTLGWLIDRLGVTEPEAGPITPEATQVRAAIATAALGAVKEHLGTSGLAEHTEAAGELVGEYETRAERAAVEGDVDQLEGQHRLRLVAIEAARERLKGHTDAVDVDTHRQIAEELDLEEQQIRRTLGEE